MKEKLEIRSMTMNEIHVEIGLIPNLGKIKNIITTTNSVKIIGKMNLGLPFSLLDINKLNTK